MYKSNITYIHTYNLYKYKFNNLKLKEREDNNMLNIYRDIQNIPFYILAYVNKEYEAVQEWADIGINLLVNKQEFKELAKKSRSPRDKFFSQFNEVRTDHDVVIIEGDNYDLYINRKGMGSHSVNKKTGAIREFKKQGGGTHYELNFANTRINVESCMFLAGCILQDQFPYTLDGFAINVIDTTGTSDIVNLNFDNLELTIKAANLAVSHKPGCLANSDFNFKKWMDDDIERKQQSNAKKIKIK